MSRALLLAQVIHQGWLQAFWKTIFSAEKKDQEDSFVFRARLGRRPTLLHRRQRKWCKDPYYSRARECPDMYQNIDSRALLLGFTRSSCLSNIWSFFGLIFLLLTMLLFADNADSQMSQLALGQEDDISSPDSKSPSRHVRGGGWATLKSGSFAQGCTLKMFRKPSPQKKPGWRLGFVLPLYGKARSWARGTSFQSEIREEGLTEYDVGRTPMESPQTRISRNDKKPTSAKTPQTLVGNSREGESLL